MVDTPNIGFERPAYRDPRWDLPTNRNWDRADLALAQLGAENLLINGTFSVWQRGASQSTSGYFSVDRWAFDIASATGSITKVPLDIETEINGSRPVNVLGLSSTSTNSSNTEKVLISQKILNVTKTSGRRVMVRLSARRASGAVNELAIEGVQGDSNGFKVEGISPQKITLTADWQTYTLFIDFPSVSGEIYATTNWSGIRIWASSGSNFDYANGSLGFQTGSCEIAEVELAVSDFETVVRRKSEEENLSDCYKYAFSIVGGEQHIGAGAVVENSVVLYGVVVPEMFAAGYAFMTFSESFRCLSNGNAVVSSLSINSLSYNSGVIAVNQTFTGLTSFHAAAVDTFTNNLVTIDGELY